MKTACESAAGSVEVWFDSLEAIGEAFGGVGLTDRGSLGGRLGVRLAEGQKGLVIFWSFVAATPFLWVKRSDLSECFFHDGVQSLCKEKSSTEMDESQTIFDGHRTQRVAMTRLPIHYWSGYLALSLYEQGTGPSRLPGCILHGTRVGVVYYPHYFSFIYETKCLHGTRVGLGGIVFMYGSLLFTRLCVYMWQEWVLERLSFISLTTFYSSMNSMYGSLLFIYLGVEKTCFSNISVAFSRERKEH